MDDDIKSHQLPEVSVGEAEHVGVVGSVVEAGVSFWDVLVISEDVMEDNSSDSGYLGAEIKSIFQSWLPVQTFVDSTLVGFHELASWLASENTSRELSHWMHILRERSNQGLFFISQSSSVKEFLLELLDLLISGVFAGKKQPQNAFRNWLTSQHCLWRPVSDFEKVVTSVLNSINGVQLRSLIEHAWHASHSTDDAANADISNLSILVVRHKFLQLELSLLDGSSHLVLQSYREVSLTLILNVL